MYTIVSTMRGSAATVTVPLPPPAPSGVNVGVPIAGNGVRLVKLALAVNVGEPAFPVATLTLNEYVPVTGAALNIVKPCEYPANPAGNVPSLKNGYAGGPPTKRNLGPLPASAVPAT